MTQRPLDLAGEQLRVMAEVPFEGVAIDHDPVLVAFRGNAVAEVLAVGVALGAEVGDDDGDPLQGALEFLRQGVDRVGDKRLESIRVGLIHCPITLPRTHNREIDMERKTRGLSALLAVIAIAAGGVVWSGCGSSSNTESVTNQAKEEIKEGTKQAEEAVQEGKEQAEKGLNEAKEQVEKNLKGKTKKKVEKATKEAEKGLEEGKEQAEKGIEEAKQRAEKYLE